MSNFDKLHELVHSLSLSERRYFKRFAARADSDVKQQYVLLFDTIAQMTTHDEVILTKKLEKLNVSTTYLAADKYYLYGVVLKTLRSYHEGRSARLRVREYLADVEILFAKGLIPHCLQILKKARQYAEKLELLSALIDIEVWQRKIEGYAYGQGDFEKKFIETSLILNKINNLNDYNLLYYRISDIQQREWKARHHELSKKIATFMAQPLLRSPDEALTLAAKIRFYEIKAKCCFVINDVAGEYASNAEIQKLIAQEEGFMEQYPFEYVALYSRYMALVKQVSPKQFYEILRQFREIPQKMVWYKTEISAHVFILSYSSELSWLIQQKQFDLALQKMPETERLFQQYAPLLLNKLKIATQYMMAYIYFVNKQFDQALTGINKILNEYDESDRPDIYSVTRLLNLVLHYEMKNYRSIIYETNNTYLFFKKRNKLFESEKIILHFLKKVQTIKTNENLRETFIKLRHKLSLICEDEYERRLLNYFDFITWLDAKIAQKDLLEVMKKKQNLGSLS